MSLINLEKWPALLLLLGTILLSENAMAIAQLFEGREEINGVTLLRDDENRSTYYYIPPFPRVANLENGQKAFSFTRFTGGSDGGGATLNLLVDLSLDDEFLADLEAKLKEKYQWARIAGPVIFTDPADDLESGDKSRASFNLVSATLGGESTQSMTSGSAPIGATGRAAIAVRLGAEDAALMWSSFQAGATTDIAFEIDAAYLVKIAGFNAVVEAEMSSVYEHFSKLKNQQQGIQRRQIRAQADEIIRNQIMSIEVSDSGKAFGISASNSEKILEMIVDKLVEVMFDVESGWSKPVQYEQAVEDGQIKGRVKGGSISGSVLGVAMFGGSVGYKEHTDYVPDDQYVLKKREDIRVNTFRLDLNRSQIIRVPYRTTGNIGNAYMAMGDDKRYFNYIDLDDESLDRVDVIFSLDGSFAKAFDTVFDSVTVEFKLGQGEDLISAAHQLNASEVSADKFDLNPFTIRRLGNKKNNWNQYQYRTIWNRKGHSEPIVSSWSTSQNTRPTLRPSLVRSEVTVLFDGNTFDDDAIKVAIVDIMSVQHGSKKILKTISLKRGVSKPEIKTTVFHDYQQPLVSRTRFISSSGAIPSHLQRIENGFVYVLAPDVTHGGRND